MPKCLTPTKPNRVAVEGFIPRHNVTTYLHAKVAILQIRKHIHNIYNNITREAVVLYMYDPKPPCPTTHHISALSRSSQKKHRQNARASPIFFSDQYKIRSPVTKNPSSRNRKSRFASPQKQSTAPSLGASPYVPYRLRRSLRLQLCILCKLMFLMFSAVSGKHERHILCPSVLMSFCFPR